MDLTATAFGETPFFALIACSLLAPWVLHVIMRRRTIAQGTVLLLGLGLIVIAGIDIVLLQLLKEIAQRTPSLADDVVFASEISLALYLMPALFAGVGVNMISHVLIRHLTAAERRYERENALG